MFSHEPLKVLRETVAKVVTEADKTPLEDDDAYARAFVQARLLQLESTVASSTWPALPSQMSILFRVPTSQCCC